MDSSIGLPEGVDPGTAANVVKVYAKDVAGVSQLFALSDDGTITQLTPGGSSGGGRFFPPEQWTVKAVAASLTNSAMFAQVSTDWDSWKAIRAGSITGLASRLTTAISAGTLAVTVTVNGTAGTLTINHTNAINSTGGIATQAAGIDAYAAGDLIGIQITTDGAWSPAGNDLEAYLELQDA